MTKLLQMLTGLEVQRVADAKAKEAQEKREMERRDKQAADDRERWEAMLKDSQAREKQRLLDWEEDKKARRARDAPKLAPLAGVEHLDVFLRTFQAHMTQFLIAKDLWTAQLLPLLDPASIAFHAGMPAEDRYDFDKVCKMLHDLHGLSPAHYRANWRDVPTFPTETAPPPPDHDQRHSDDGSPGGPAHPG